MLKKIILTLLSACLLASSVCYAQETGGNETKKYKEGVYTIGKSIPMGEYYLLANNPNKIAAYIIYDGNNTPGKDYSEKYTFENADMFRYPEIMKRIPAIRIRYRNVPEFAYDFWYDDYFEYNTKVDLQNFKRTGDISPRGVGIAVSYYENGISDLENCYIKLINCTAVPTDSIGKLDISRNGTFKVGRDIPAGEYEVEYVARNSSDIKYAVVNNGVNYISKSATTLYVDDKDRLDAKIKLNSGDYIAKRDVNLKSTDGTTVFTHKPREVGISDTDTKYNISNVREDFKKNIEAEIDKNLDNRYYHKLSKANSQFMDDYSTMKKWVDSARNSDEKKYAYTVGEIYCHINEFLRNSVYSSSAPNEKEPVVTGIKYPWGKEIYATDNIYAVNSYEDKRINYYIEERTAPLTYKNFFKSIQNAKSFSDIEYLCDKIIADMY